MEVYIIDYYFTYFSQSSHREVGTIHLALSHSLQVNHILTFKLEIMQEMIMNKSDYLD